jgi:hypothetical protein
MPLCPCLEAVEAERRDFQVTLAEDIREIKVREAARSREDWSSESTSESACNPPKCFHLENIYWVKDFVSSQDPEGYTGDSTAAGKVSLTGQAKDEESD